MQSPISEYLKSVKKAYENGQATEHSHRGFLQTYLQSISDCLVTNEPKRQKCGAPDYIIERKGVPIGYIEAKDIGIDLDKIEKSEQLKRYFASLDNLILTDYLEFRLYRCGQKLLSCRIAHIADGKLHFDSDNYQKLEQLLNDFFGYKGITIKNADKLAKIMAAKAQLLQEIIYNTLEQAVKDYENETDNDDSSLLSQYQTFRAILIHDLNERQFADIYAQTITYGLFAARLNDDTLEDFSRQEAAYLVPKTNPFLQKLFSYIAGPDIDTRIEWVVDELADVFAACDVASLLTNFGTEQDPFIHFYETFLAEYDGKLRKSRGVYYTPKPVVDFIVRSVDNILINDFGLPMGLADNQKVTVKMRHKISGDLKNTEIHRVQILDPATGTGTFLYEVLDTIQVYI